MKEEELSRIEEAVKACTKCELHKTRHNIVFGTGNIDKGLIFIGEAPGYNEDMQGKPFVGRAGTFLNELLKSIDLKREDIYITNILKCRPPNNRDPKEEEIKACTPYLNKQLEIIQPKVIVTLGNYATKFILKKFGYKEESVSKVHGKVFKVRNLIFNLKIMPSYHPAAALYNPNLRKILFEDFKTIKRELEMER